MKNQPDYENPKLQDAAEMARDAAEYARKFARLQIAMAQDATKIDPVELAASTVHAAVFLIEQRRIEQSEGKLADLL